MKILIKVTKEVLQRSLYCNTIFNEGPTSENCAISTGIRDLFPGAQVYETAIKFSGSDSNFTDWTIGRGLLDMSRHSLLPQAATDFIREFDSYARVEDINEDLLVKAEKRLLLPEFSFEIDVPEEVIQQIGISQVFKVLSESPTLEHVNP